MALIAASPIWPFQPRRCTTQHNPKAAPLRQAPAEACQNSTPDRAADVDIESPRHRSIATIHTLIAFAFNTLVLALTVNLVASTF